METKTCSKCGETKPLDMFKADKRKPNGRGSQCKACHNLYNALYNGSPEARQRYKDRYTYDRRKYQATVNRGHERWHAAHPGANSAQKRVNYAVMVGKMPRVSTLLCVHCGAPAAAYHHHLGYERAHHLDVIPLCRNCHRLAHQGENQ